jgi:hypothetical protein
MHDPTRGHHLLPNDAVPPLITSACMHAQQFQGIRMKRNLIVAILLISAFLVALHQFIYWKTWFSIDDIHHETFVIALTSLALGILISKKLE